MVEIDAADLVGSLTQCLLQVEGGETILITKDQKPVAELKPVRNPESAPRPFGLCKGEFTVPDDFDDPLPERILAEFEGLRGPDQAEALREGEGLR